MSYIQSHEGILRDGNDAVDSDAEDEPSIRDSCSFVHDPYEQQWH